MTISCLNLKSCAIRQEGDNYFFVSKMNGKQYPLDRPEAIEWAKRQISSAGVLFEPRRGAMLTLAGGRHAKGKFMGAA